MYPEVFPGKPDPANPEFEVYQILKKLPDQYSVLYSKRLRGGPFSRQESEIDFIVTNHRDVIICLEVKGGLVEHDGASDTWTQNGKRMDVNPDVQAAGATHTFMRLLPREIERINVDWGLCFPQCCLTTSSRTLGIDPEQIIDEQATLNIEAAIARLEDRIRKKYKKLGLTPAEFKRLLEILTRSIGFMQILGVRIAREAEQIIQATAEQCEVLADVEINPRMIIHGSAGTGKTVLAQTFAKRLAAQKKRVLLLFYNKGIASTVRYAFDRSSTATVSTFSSFAKRLVQEVDPTWWDSLTERSDDFWRIELPSRLLDIPPDQLPKFDAVIVDEGQDFKPEWYEFLQKLISPGDQTHFTVFLDEHQDIFHHWKTFPCSPPPAKKVLTKNCRNTRTIVSYLNTTYPTGMTHFEASPVGTPIIERTTKNDVDEQTQIVRDVKYLTNTDKIPPGSIVILLNSDKSDSCLKETKSIAGFPLQSTYERYDPKARVVYYSTIDIFKGLEADVVLVSLGSKLTAGDLPNALYVQGSRAKHVLYIYRRG